MAKLVRVIFFGCVRSYQDANGLTVYVAEYLSEDGVAHRDRLDVQCFNNIKLKGIAPGTLIEGVFDVDSFNSLRLVDLNS